jgi:hypothetical protein
MPDGDTKNRAQTAADLMAAKKDIDAIWARIEKKDAELAEMKARIEALKEKQK